MRNLLPLAALLFVACGASVQSNGSAEQPTLEVDPAMAAPGDSVTLILRNGTEGEVGYNLCSSGLEQRIDEETWEPIPAERFCTMELRMLAAGEEATYSIGLPSELEPGEYRFTTSIERLPAGAFGEIQSEVFAVGS
ncbi:MAG: hypothetical protein GEU90_10390 [Gemmatimonas sp.]|nr:hypothetical protein [Gemmatimonas sp.]